MKAQPRRRSLSQRLMIADALAIATERLEHQRRVEEKLAQVELTLAINVERMAQIQVEIDSLKEFLSKLSPV